MFKHHGFTLIDDPVKADIVVWTGGADISPMLYGEIPLKTTYSDSRRDTRDIRYWRIVKKDALKIGICRGGQLLNVLNGGRLWQHVNNHSESHTVTDVKTGKIRSVSSTHHQMFIPAPDAEIVAIARLASIKRNETLNWQRPAGEIVPGSKHYELGTDYEVLFYPDTRSLCFQGHPEYGTPVDTQAYFFEVLKRYL